MDDKVREYKIREYEQSGTESGWLSPTGRFYGVQFACHNFYSELKWDKREEELEKLGWLKISRIRNTYEDRGLSEEQHNWFTQNDYIYDWYTDGWTRL